MSNPRAEVYAEMLDLAVKTTATAAEGIAEDMRMSQVKEGKGHPLWFLGHSAFALNQIVNVWALGGEPVIPMEYGVSFQPKQAGGGPITTDASKYPAWNEVLENYKKAGAACVEGIKGLSDDELPGDLKGDVPEAFKNFFGNLDATLKSMIAHDAYHRGQMTLLASLNK